MPLLRQIAQLGHPVLRHPTDLVETPAPDPIRTLAEDMIATMIEANGVGIAAPQVYDGHRLFILGPRPNPRYPDAPAMDPVVVVNPEIVERSDEIVKGWEGCLSIPGLRGLVPRHQRIVARYQTLDGETVEAEYDGFIARVFQHEFDHLHGLVFLDRLESPRDIVMEQEYRRMMA